jgi:ATP-dependent protease ClpP protease subunit
VADNLGLPIVGAGDEDFTERQLRGRDRFSWTDHLRLALLMLPFGHMFFEQVYRYDEAPAVPDPQARAAAAAHDLEGQRRPRRRPGLDRAVRHRLGGRRAAPLPVNRLVAYVLEREGGNWLGQSLLRSAYKNWLLKDRALRTWSTSIDRNGIGIPDYEAAENETSSTPASRSPPTCAPATTPASPAQRRKLNLLGVRARCPTSRSSCLPRLPDRPVRARPLPQPRRPDQRPGRVLQPRLVLADTFHLGLDAVAELLATAGNAHVVEDLVDINFGPDESRTAAGLRPDRHPPDRARPRPRGRRPRPRTPTSSSSCAPSPASGGRVTRTTRADRHPEPHASALASALGAQQRRALAATAAPPTGETATTAELWLYGVVGGYWFGFNDKTVADQLRGLNVDQITVRLNSPAATPSRASRSATCFRNHKANVTVVVDGLAASAASIIAIAGDEVVMSPGSQMMIHDPWFFTMGNAKELRQDADFLDKQGANMAGVYACRAGGTAEEWRAAMTAEPDGTWYTADEAVDAKLADRVGTVVAVGAAPEPPPRTDLDDEGDDMAAAPPGTSRSSSPRRARRLERARPQAPDRVRGRVTPTPKEVLPWRSATSRSPPCGRSSASPRTRTRPPSWRPLDEALDERAEPPPATPPEIPEGTWSSRPPSSRTSRPPPPWPPPRPRACTTRSATVPRQRAGQVPAHQPRRLGGRVRPRRGRRPRPLRRRRPVLIPTTELGHGDQPEATADDELYALVFGDEKKGA